LLDLVGAAGIDVAFGHECMRVLPQEAGATFRHRGGEAQVEADILLGCDGSNSVVRQEMSRRGARLDLMQRYIAHSYVELIIPSPGGGRYCWSDSDANAARPMALHVWPRGNLMLLALPNGDGTYTASLFAPTHTADAAEPSFERLTRPSDFVDLFEKYYPDALPHIPNLATDLAAAQPAALRTIKCAPYHHGRTVLLGDAAHTMAPFFGQGVNSGFEDVHHLFALLDRDLPGRDLPADVCRRLAEFSTSRVSQGHAITDLSLGNFQELVDHSGTRAFQARHRIERELHLRSPDTFRPLLNMVSFSDLQYDEVASVHRHQAAALDELCRTYDSITQGDRIVEAYLAMQQGRGIPDLTAALLPTLSAMGRIETDRHS
jgi:2-polyprenyl-6-methoxyphenol hydroxylase-like FAD-dependent oxidoreductase